MKTSVSFYVLHSGYWTVMYLEILTYLLCYLSLKQGHLHTYRFCDNVWTFILQDATFKNDEMQETVNRVKIVACDSKLLSQWIATLILSLSHTLSLSSSHLLFFLFFFLKPSLFLLWGFMYEQCRTLFFEPRLFRIYVVLQLFDICWR